MNSDKPLHLNETHFRLVFLLSLLVAAAVFALYWMKINLPAEEVASPPPDKGIQGLMYLEDVAVKNVSEETLKAQAQYLSKQALKAKK